MMGILERIQEEANYLWYEINSKFISNSIISLTN